VICEAWIFFILFDFFNDFQQLWSYAPTIHILYILMNATLKHGFQKIVVFVVVYKPFHSFPMGQTVNINIHHNKMAQHTSHNFAGYKKFDKNTIIHNNNTLIINKMMKGIPHFDFQQLWSEKLLRSICFKIICFL